MIRVYWPYKRVPEWLQLVKATKNGQAVSVTPVHKGFGIVAKVHGEYFVWGAAGTFMHINGNGSTLEIKGGDKGVNIYTSICGWIGAIKFALQDRGS